jgi:ElaB/YqjD/DUF883 family membrane-anchored ribosome-binding protein
MDKIQSPGSSGLTPEAITSGVDAAGAALHSGIDKVANPARNTVERVSAAAHETVDKLANSANHVADRISDQTRRVTGAPAHAMDVSRSWVVDKPFEAVGAALAIGFILGRLTGR